MREKFHKEIVTILNVYKYLIYEHVRKYNLGPLNKLEMLSVTLQNKLQAFFVLTQFPTYIFNSTWYAK